MLSTLIKAAFVGLLANFKVTEFGLDETRADDT